MVPSIGHILESTGPLKGLKFQPLGQGPRSHAIPGSRCIPSDRSRRLASTRSQVGYVPTIDSANNRSNGHSAMDNDRLLSAVETVAPEYRGVSELDEAAAKFKAFLQAGGGHLPPGSLKDSHIDMFMDFYFNYQRRHHLLFCTLGPANHGTSICKQICSHSGLSFQKRQVVGRFHHSFQITACGLLC
jgi:hypothetical protein